MTEHVTITSNGVSEHFTCTTEELNGLRDYLARHQHIPATALTLIFLGHIRRGCDLNQLPIPRCGQHDQST